MELRCKTFLRHKEKFIVKLVMEAAEFLATIRVVVLVIVVKKVF
jgi:hypothetical protein